MKANFPLSDIEQHLDDEVLLQAEELYEKHAMKAFAELEKNLWTARFDDDTEGLIEAEVQLVGARVKNYTCECNTFRRLNVCHHIASTLMALRKRKQAERQLKESTQKAPRPESDTPNRLTVQNIIKRIDPAQLIEFIADYARQDKQLALALKTRFAGDINIGNVAEHYKTLIDNTLRAAKNLKGKVTPKGWLQIFTMIDELRQKSEAHLKQGELNTSFEFIKITLPLVHRFFRSTDSPKPKLDKRQAHLMEILRGFEGLIISPELSEIMWDFMTAEYTQNTRHYFSIPIFEWVLSHSGTETRTEQLLQIIDSQMVVHKIFIEARDRLLTQKIQVFQKSGRIEDASKLILGSSQNPDVLFFAIQNAFSIGDLKLAKNLCENGLNIFKSSKASAEQIEEYLLQIAQKESDTEGVLRYAERRFLKTLNLDYFTLLRKHQISSDKLKKIAQTIESQTFRVEKRDALAAIYFSEKQYDKLIELIRSLQSLELIKRYGVELWTLDNANGIALHKEILYEYLSSHLGRPPALRIRSILDNHVLKNGQALAEILMADIKKDFPERYSLKEEFETLISELDKKEVL